MLKYTERSDGSVTYLRFVLGEDGPFEIGRLALGVHQDLCEGTKEQTPQNYEQQEMYK